MKIFLLVATNYGVGLTSISLGLLHKLESLGYKTGFFKPVSQTDDPIDQSTKLASVLTNNIINSNISCVRARSRLADGNQELLMEEIIESFENQNNNLDSLVIEGLVPTRHLPYANQINTAIAKTMNADVFIVSDGSTASDTSVADAINITASIFGVNYQSNIIGYIINKATIDDNSTDLTKKTTKGIKKNLKCFAVIPYKPEFTAPIMSDLVTDLNANILNEGDLATRRVMSYTLIARTVENAVAAIKPGNLIITPADRSDIILAACMASLSGVRLAGLLLTGGLKPSASIMNLCSNAFNSGLPVIAIDLNSYSTIALIDRLPKKISISDKDRLIKITHEIAEKIHSEDIKHYFKGVSRTSLSPAAFRYQLRKKAKQHRKSIVLPEGTDPRIIEAAIVCHKREIADCVLLGNPDEIRKIAEDLGLIIPKGLKIKNPNDFRVKYSEKLVEIRKTKQQINKQMALSILEDDIVVGTMMLALGEVDGLVAGACNPTANTLRPAFQIIKPKEKLVSSVFFMLMPDEVCIYGDCAVNPNPTAEQLAIIASQSAHSAQLFNILPKIAMISYSTGISGTGVDVDLVLKATNIIRSQRPDLIIDGPLQYDAASVIQVAKTKAPQSKVAGSANVFIFPDLNTGNTTYKAVQRNANIISIGPILQGLNKPVNDLSRGATLDDIVYTIAVTAIQAQ
jgi:phosphate acetyltransferase